MPHPHRPAVFQVHDTALSGRRRRHRHPVLHAAGAEYGPRGALGTGPQGGLALGPAPTPDTGAVLDEAGGLGNAAPGGGHRARERGTDTAIAKMYILGDVLNYYLIDAINSLHPVHHLQIPETLYPQTP